MKLLTYRPITFLSLTSATSFFTTKSKEFITVISVNNINNLLVRLRSVALSTQKMVGFFLLKNSTPYISKNIQRFILVGWIDRP